MIHNIRRFLIAFLVLSLCGNIFLFAELKQTKDPLPSKTVSMNWPIDWKELPSQTAQQKLLSTPWYINQQIGLWLFGINTECYQEVDETHHVYSSVIAQHGHVFSRDGGSKPGIYQNQNDLDAVFVCTYYKPSGTYSGYSLRYNPDKRSYDIQKKEVTPGIIIALE